MSNLTVVTSIFANLYHVFTSAERNDGLGEMPVYHEDEEQEYIEHYIALDHDNYLGNVSISYNEESDEVNMFFTTDDEDDGTDSNEVFTEEEESIVFDKMMLLKEIYMKEFADKGLDIPFNVSQDPS